MRWPLGTALRTQAEDGPRDERVVGVVRDSDTTDVTTAPERQRSSILNASAARGLTIVGWAEDLDASASKKVQITCVIHTTWCGCIAG